MQTPLPSWRALRCVSRWAIVACAGWACLNPQPDTDPLLAEGDGSYDGVSPAPVESMSNTGAGGGASDVTAQPGKAEAAGSGGTAGNVGAGSVAQLDAGVPELDAGAGGEVSDAGP